MCCGPFNAVPMVDTALASFVVNVEILQVVVKVNGARAKITAEKGRVGREDSCNVDVTLAAQGDG